MTVGDLAAVQAVERSAGELFRSVPEQQISKCADHDPMSTEDLSVFVAEGRAWIATDDGVVAGMIVVRDVDGCAHVEEMAVAPDFGRRGYGSALLEVVASWAERTGAPAVTLTTFRDVPWNRPFYEHRGFRVLSEDELSPALAALFEDEEVHYGLARELRVVMRRDLTQAHDA